MTILRIERWNGTFLCSHSSYAYAFICWRWKWIIKELEIKRTNMKYELIIMKNVHITQEYGKCSFLQSSFKSQWYLQLFVFRTDNDSFALGIVLCLWFWFKQRQEISKERKLYLSSCKSDWNPYCDFSTQFFYLESVLVWVRELKSV